MLTLAARLTALPARTVIALLSATLILLITTANLPALLLWSFTPDGPARTHALIHQITTWTRTLTR